MDLTTLHTTNEAEMDLVALDGEPTGMFLTIAGPYSDTVKSYQKAADLKRQRLTRRFGNKRRLSTKEQEQMSALVEDLVEKRLEASVIGWGEHYPSEADPEKLETKDTLSLSGEELKWSKQTVHQVFEDVPIVKEQVAAFALDEANFSKES